MKLPLQASGIISVRETVNNIGIGVSPSQEGGKVDLRKLLRFCLGSYPVQQTAVIDEDIDQLVVTPGTRRSACCGSVDTWEMTGKNCTSIAPHATCAGDVLSCPPSTSEAYTSEGDAFCA